MNGFHALTGLIFGPGAMNRGFGIPSEAVVTQPGVTPPPGTAPLARRRRRSRPAITRTISQSFHRPLFALTAPCLPREKTLDERLEEAACVVPAFAQQADTQRWAAAVLTRSDNDLTTDLGVASALLSAVQAIVRAPVDKVVLLAAGLAAVGLSTFLVAHDDRPLVAVHVDGAWRYADPIVVAEFGSHLPFVRERFFSVPALPTPEQTLVKEELARVRLEKQELEAQVTELARAYDAEVEHRSYWLQTAVIVGVVLIVLVLLSPTETKPARRLRSRDTPPPPTPRR